MTIREMQIFVTLFQTSNVTRTAEKLFMAQSAVSRSIGVMERHYGIRLFDRLNNRLFPTEAAKEIYPLVVQILAFHTEAEDLLRADDFSETIQIGATTTIGSYLLPKIIRQYENRRLNVKINVTVMSGSELLPMVEKNDLDFALVEAFAEGKNLITEELFTDKLVLAFSPECDLKDQKEISFSDLNQYPLLMRDKGSLTRNMIDQVFCRHEVSPALRLESGSIHTILEFVQSNLGVAFVPEGIARPYLDAGLICTADLTDQTLYRKNYLVRHKDKVFSKSCGEFLSLIRASIDNE